MDSIQSALRPFPRPEPSDEEKSHLNEMAKFYADQPKEHLAFMLARLLIENARMTAEVNIHRRARNFEPLPTYPDRLAPMVIDNASSTIGLLDSPLEEKP